MTERVADASAQADALLEVEGLHASYGGVRALRGVSLTVPQHGIVAVLGNNGAGKSTLLRALSGVLQLMGGSVDEGAHPLRREGPRRPRPGATSSAPASPRRPRAGACSRT